MTIIADETPKVAKITKKPIKRPEKKIPKPLKCRYSFEFNEMTDILK